MAVTVWVEDVAERGLGEAGEEVMGWEAGEEGRALGEAGEEGTGWEAAEEAGALEGRAAEMGTGLPGKMGRLAPSCTLPCQPVQHRTSACGRGAAWQQHQWLGHTQPHGPSKPAQVTLPSPTPEVPHVPPDMLMLPHAVPKISALQCHRPIAPPSPRAPKHSQGASVLQNALQVALAS